MTTPLIRLAGGVSIFTLFTVLPAAQGLDSEPNNPCEFAQEFGGVALPFTVTGELTESTPNDVDFFRFSAAPGESLQAALTSTGATGLDPYLGLFDSSCGLLAIDDDGGGYPNSFMTFTVPDDGRYILAVSSCCDYDFTGGYSAGSYTLSVGPRQFSGPVEGRMVDADTGIGLAGDFPTYANAILLLCRYGGCWDWVQNVAADADGNFVFSENFYGERLSPGTYQIQAYAQGYQQFASETFTLEADQSLNLGVVQLTPRRFIGSLQGRLLDANDRTPLSGEAPNWSTVYLYFCDNGVDCFYFSAYGSVDGEGRFFISGPASWVEPGYYQVRAYADQYQPEFIGPLFIGRDEVVDLGDIPVEPVRLQMFAVDGCSAQEIGSGNCILTAQLRNATRSRLAGEVWAAVNVYNTNTPGYYSSFQLGKVGAANPMPQKVSLRAGERANFNFQLKLPKTLADYSLVCVQAFVGLNPDATFNPENVRDFSCFYKFEGSLQPLSEKDARRMLKEQRNQAR